MIPLTITAPAGEVDAAPIALTQVASELSSHGLLNGEIGLVSDPKRPWSEKVAAIIETVEKNREHVVILCDEPRSWYRLNQSLVDGSPDCNAQSLAEWFVNRVQCRRIVAGWISNNSPVGRSWAPRLHDGRELLEDEADCGVLWGSAAQLRCAPGSRSRAIGMGNEAVRCNFRFKLLGRSRPVVHVASLSKGFARPGS